MSGILNDHFGKVFSAIILVMLYVSAVYPIGAFGVIFASWAFLRWPQFYNEHIAAPTAEGEKPNWSEAILGSGYEALWASALAVGSINLLTNILGAGAPDGTCSRISQQFC